MKGILKRNANEDNKLEDTKIKKKNCQELNYTRCK